VDWTSICTSTPTISLHGIGINYLNTGTTFHLFYAYKDPKSQMSILSKPPLLVGWYCCSEYRNQEGWRSQGQPFVRKYLYVQSLCTDFLRSWSCSGAHGWLFNKNAGNRTLQSLLINYVENYNPYSFISFAPWKERLIFTELVCVATTTLRDYTCIQKCLVRSFTALPTHVLKCSQIYWTSSERLIASVV
jgi:hypothetical protein